MSSSFDVGSDLAFLTPALAKSGGMLSLNLMRNGFSLSSIAGTPNDSALTGAIDSLGTNSALYGEFVSLGKADA